MVRRQGTSQIAAGGCVCAHSRNHWDQCRFQFPGPRLLQCPRQWDFWILSFALFIDTCWFGSKLHLLVWPMQDKDQEQFTKQLLYYLGAFAGGIPVSIYCCTFLGIARWVFPSLLTAAGRAIFAEQMTFFYPFIFGFQLFSIHEKIWKKIEQLNSRCVKLLSGFFNWLFHFFPKICSCCHSYKVNVMKLGTCLWPLMILLNDV